MPQPPRRCKRRKRFFPTMAMKGHQGSHNPVPALQRQQVLDLATPPQGLVVAAPDATCGAAVASPFAMQQHTGEHRAQSKIQANLLSHHFADSTAHRVSSQPKPITPCMCLVTSYKSTSRLGTPFWRQFPGCQAQCSICCSWPGPILFAIPQQSRRLTA